MKQVLLFSYHMKLLSKFSLKYFLPATLTITLLCTLTWKTFAHYTPTNYFSTALTSFQDTTKPLPRKLPGQIPVTSRDTVPRDSAEIVNDTIPKPADSTISVPRTDTFTLKISKDTLDAPVNYEATDSAVVLVQDKKIILYGKTKTDYKDISLSAPKVELDQKGNTITAFNSTDPTGYVLERAVFTQGDNQFQSDTIVYNLKTQRGITKNTFTQEGEIFVQGEYIKKVSDDVFYVGSGRFTTCNLDDPHFAFLTRRMKVINNKIAVSGPTHPEFEKVPVPIYLPFGLYPLYRGRHSGFLPPQFTANEDFGLGLEGIGYYHVLNQYLDVTVRTNIYSYGGWIANITPTYRKRYRYNGSFNLSVQNTKIHFKGDPDFQKNKSYFVTWSHNVDSRARPGTNFSANVSAGSTKYNEFLPNNPNRNFQNHLSSSISYGKTWGEGKYNLTLNANHSQNNQLRLISVNLPDIGFGVTTFYPLAKKDIVGTPKWYEKLGLAYNTTIRNQFSFYDTAFSFRQIADTLQWGARHNVPINLPLPPLGPFLVAPSFSYEEIWIGRKIRRQWNDAAQKVDTVSGKGFYTDRSTSFGIGVNTSVYGTYEFRNSKIIAIRHVMRPSVTASYRPDLSRQHFYTTRVNVQGDSLRFSEFEGSMYGFFQEGQYGGLSFSLDNSLELKRRSRKDTAANATEKVRLIDGFGLTTAYNFIADSFQLSPINVYFRSTLFEKINITAGATLDPYQRDLRGRPIDRFVWQGDKFSLGRIRTGNIAISTQFQSKSKDPQQSEQRKMEIQERLNDPSLIADQQRLLDHMQRNPAEFVDFNIPWTLGLSFSLFFTERLKPDYSGFETDFNSNVNFNGSFNLTDKWNFSLNGYYDFDTKQLQTFSMSVSRDMHCWQMSISVTPVGLTRFFNISISPKSSILQDLRINRTRSFSDY